MLDLEAIIYPCPKGGTRFRDRVKRRGGQLMFPYFIDPNTPAIMSQRYRGVSVLHLRRRRATRAPARAATAANSSSRPRFVDQGRGQSSTPPKPPSCGAEISPLAVSV
jgi:hypothetical protein